MRSDTEPLRRELCVIGGGCPEDPHPNPLPKGEGERAAKAPRRRGVLQRSPRRGLCVTRGWVPGGPLTGFGRRRPNPSASSGQALPLPLERVKSGDSSCRLTPNTVAHRFRLEEIDSARSPLGLRKGLPGQGARTVATSRTRDVMHRSASRPTTERKEHAHAVYPTR